MRSAVKDKNYVKVFILYLLKNIGKPLDYNTINDIVLYDGYVGYFDFAACFAELLDDEHVAEIKGIDGALDTYVITPRGISIAESLAEDIFSDIRDKSLKSALKLLSFKEREAELVYECEELDPDEGGGCMVTCGIREKKRDVCMITVKVDTKQRAEAIKKNFYDHPEVVFRGTIALLSGNMNLIF